MARQVIRTVPINNFTGEATSPPANVPDAATQIALTLDATTMTDPAIAGSLRVEISLDGGATFDLLAEMTFVGGAKTKGGEPVAAYERAIPLTDGLGRKVRGVLSATGPRFSSTLSIDVT